MIRLSYPVTPLTPLYPGTPPFSTRHHRSIDGGDISNHSLAGFSLHSGTHIDAPLHFCAKGASVSAMLEPDTSFFPSCCLDIPRGPDQRITESDLRSIEGKLPRDAEAVLIRTGFCGFRSTLPEDYAQRNPVIEPGAATFLREACPALRLVGIDTISVAHHLHREEGRACHRIFLCGTPPVLILEDADLRNRRLGERPFGLRIFPFIHGEVEATPVAAVAEFTLRRKRAGR